ncbi:MAG: hypothetical protein ABH986_03010 [archaeon]
MDENELQEISSEDFDDDFEEIPDEIPEDLKPKPPFLEKKAETNSRRMKFQVYAN